jgi:hypothetical protein
MVSDRLIHLQNEVVDYYAQLAGKEKARRLAPQEEKVRIQQQIVELQKELVNVERNYWYCWSTEVKGLTIPDADAEVITDKILAEVESLSLVPTVQENQKIFALLQNIKTELTKPGTLAAGKLKVVIPLFPGLLSYEFELDTEGLLRRTFPTFCKLADRLKK